MACSQKAGSYRDWAKRSDELIFIPGFPGGPFHFRQVECILLIAIGSAGFEAAYFIFQFAGFPVFIGGADTGKTKYSEVLRG